MDKILGEIEQLNEKLIPLIYEHELTTAYVKVFMSNFNEATEKKDKIIVLPKDHPLNKNIPAGFHLEEPNVNYKCIGKFYFDRKGCDSSAFVEIDTDTDNVITFGMFPRWVNIRVGLRGLVCLEGEYYNSSEISWVKFDVDGLVNLYIPDGFVLKVE